MSNLVGTTKPFQDDGGIIMVLKNFSSIGEPHHGDCAQRDARHLFTILGDFESATIPYGKNWLHQKKGMHL